MTADWRLVRDPRSPSGVEDWTTTEAMGCALEGLQAYLGG
jgi:hypothetical protein